MSGKCNICGHELTENYSYSSTEGYVCENCAKARAINQSEINHRIMEELK